MAQEEPKGTQPLRAQILIDKIRRNNDYLQEIKYSLSGFVDGFYHLDENETTREAGTTENPDFVDDLEVQLELQRQKLHELDNLVKHLRGFI